MANRLWGVAVSLLVAVVLGGMAYLLPDMHGRSEIGPEWLAAVQAGETLYLSDLGRGLAVELDDGSLVFRESARWLPMVLSLPFLLMISAIGFACFLGAGRPGRERRYMGLLGVVLLSCPLLLGGVLTRGVEHSVRPGQVASSHTVFFGALWWSDQHGITGAPAWFPVEDCSDIEGTTVCVGWLNIELPSKGGTIRLARMPHSRGARPEHDRSQEDAAANLVNGITIFLSGS